MRKPRISLLAIVGVAALLFGLTSCSKEESSQNGSGATVENNLNNDNFKKISEADFKSALANTEVSVDEFKGNSEIGGTGEIMVKIGANLIGVTLAVLRDDSNSDWYPDILTAYSGKDWIFHNELNLKSSNGVLNLIIDPSLRDDEVESGYVSEIAEFRPSKKEALDFCNIVSGKEVKFRLQGNGGVDQVTGQMGAGGIKDILNVCTVYFGLQQGLKIQK